MHRAPTEWRKLLVHCLHNGANNTRKNCTTTRAANGIAEKATQCTACGSIPTSSTAQEATKNCPPPRDTAIS